jgi:hypothetical protein
MPSCLLSGHPAHVHGQGQAAQLDQEKNEENDHAEYLKQEKKIE